MTASRQMTFSASEEAHAAPALPLRPYQTEALDASTAAEARGILRQLISLPTGCGKTVIFAHKISRTPGRALVLAHRDELISQAADKLHQVAPGLDLGIVKAQRDETGAEVVVASVQTLARQVRLDRLGREFALVVVDECFPAGTLVGDLLIEQVQVGDTVPSYDQRTGRIVSRPVTHVWRRPAAALVRVDLVDGAPLVCTPNHPILTSDGWVAAGQLRPSQEVARVRCSSDRNLHTVRDQHRGCQQAPKGHAPEGGAGLLLRRLPGRLGSQAELRADGTDQPSLCRQSDAGEQSDAPRRRTRTHAGDAARDRPPATGQEGQWVRAVGAAAATRHSVGVADGGGGPDGDATRKRLPDLLQARHRRPDEQGRYRGRRGLAWPLGPQGTGCQEGAVPGWTRVDRIAVLEPGRDGTFGGVCPDGQVYNLEVEGTHTYLADGVVAHNCHHATAVTYRRILEHLGAFAADGSGPLVLGVTATPERADKIGLGHVFEEIVYERGLVEMIAASYLCDLRGQVVGTDADLGRLRVAHGDFVDAEVAAELERSGALDQIAGAYAKYAADRNGLAFLPTVATAHELAGLLCGRGIAAEALDGTTPTETRRAILGRLHAGTTQVVANCGVLLEGFDEPSVSCILMARPTRSRPLYIQAVGRGTRTHPGKTDCLILDLAGVTERHDLTTLADLAGLEPAALDGKTLTEAIAEARATGNQAALELRLPTTTGEIALFRSTMRWLPVGGEPGGFVLPCDRDATLWGAETRIRAMSRCSVPSVDALRALADRPLADPPAGPLGRR